MGSKSQIMTCPLNKQKPYFIYPSIYRNSQSTTSLPICPHTEAHAIRVFKHYFTAWKSLMWDPCNKFHNSCQNCTETRGSKIGKRLLICCVKTSQFCSNYGSALHLLVPSLSTEFTSCRQHLCQWHTHTPPHVVGLWTHVFLVFVSVAAACHAAAAFVVGSFFSFFLLFLTCSLGSQ